MKVEELDLSGVKCPLNFVKIKLKLKKLQTGEQLLVKLDPSEETKVSVKNSLLSEEIKILETQEKPDSYLFLLEK